MREVMRAGKDLIRLVHVADTMDHHASHGLRYISNPPGNTARVHQHLRIGDGDVDWDDFFGGLAEIGFYDSDPTPSCATRCSPRTSAPTTWPATSSRP